MKYFKTYKSRKYPFLENELKEYFTFPKEYYGIPVDFALDNYCFYKSYTHNLWLYFRNGYNDCFKNKWLPLIISEAPHIPINYKLNISEEDFDKIKKFAIINKDNLYDFSNNGDYSIIRDIDNKTWSKKDSINFFKSDPCISK